MATRTRVGLLEKISVGALDNGDSTIAAASNENGTKETKRQEKIGT